MKWPTLILVSILAVGCVPQYPERRLGQFTAASSFNVRYLDYDKDSAIRVLGEDCQLFGHQPNDSRLQRAMDDAIRKGQEQGVKGDLLVNVRIDEVRKTKKINSIFGQLYECIEVEGDLVSLNK